MPTRNQKIALAALVAGGVSVAAFLLYKVSASNTTKSKARRRTKRSAGETTTTPGKSGGTTDKQTVVTFLSRMVGHSYDAMTQLNSQIEQVKQQLRDAGQHVSDAQLHQIMQGQFQQAIMQARSQVARELGLPADKLEGALETYSKDEEVNELLSRFQKVIQGETDDESNRLKGLDVEKDTGMSKERTLELLQNSVNRSVAAKHESLKEACEKHGLSKEKVKQKLQEDEAFVKEFVELLQSRVVQVQRDLLKEHDLSIGTFEEAVRAYSEQDEDFKSKAHKIRSNAAQSVMDD